MPPIVGDAFPPQPPIVEIPAPPQLNSPQQPNITVENTCGYPDNKGDGYCDDDNNNEGCDWDGGDCCGENVKMDNCTYCECLGL